MGQRILISFMGRGRRSQAESAVGPSSTPTGYQNTAYRFSDPRGEGGVEKHATFFGWALMARLADLGQRPDRLLILGTETSSWSLLADVFMDALEEERFDAVATWQARMRSGESRGEVVNGADLEEFHALSAGSPRMAGVAFDLIRPGRDAAEQHDMMRVLLRHLGEGDEVILDITHGYRHLPVMAAFMLSALQWRYNLSIQSLYYGALEMQGPDGPAPVIDLSVIPEYTRITTDLATYRNTGNYAQLGRALDMMKPVRELYFLEGITREGRAQEKAATCLESLKSKQGLNPLQEEIRSLLKESLTRQKGPVAKRFLELARASLGREDYLKAVIFGFEAAHRHAGLHRGALRQRFPGLYEDSIRAAALQAIAETCDPQGHFDRLRRLRNVIVHAGVPGNDDTEVKDALRDEHQFRAVVRPALDTIEAMLRVTVTDEIWQATAHILDVEIAEP